jgi:hypothetical protein
MSAGNAEVFISYARQDGPRVEPIVARLEAAGVRVWLDRESITGGAAWAAEIVRGIKGCKLLILMCTDAAMRSRAVQQEIQLAWKYQRPYLPLLLEPTKFPEQLEFFLEGCQWIEVQGDPAERWLPAILRALARVGISAGPPASDAGTSVRLTTPGRGLEGLRKIARFTHRLWPLVVEKEPRFPTFTRFTVPRRPHLGRSGDSSKASEGRPRGRHRLRLGSQLFWAIDWDRDAHLLLLDENPEGRIYCLCPSWFAPETRMKPGLTLLPQESANEPSLSEPFVVSGVPGRDHVLAILADQPLALNWLPPNKSEPARVLAPTDIADLLSRLDELEAGAWTALATCCEIEG